MSYLEFVELIDFDRHKSVLPLLARFLQHTNVHLNEHLLLKIGAKVVRCYVLYYMHVISSTIQRIVRGLILMLASTTHLG
jgi:hypothetical protein